MNEQPDSVLFKFKESWILFVAAGFVFSIFTFSPNGYYLWPVGVVLAYLILRPFRVIKAYVDYLEIKKPIAFKEIKIEYRNITRIRHQPAAFRNPNAIIFYYRDGTKEKKIAFSERDVLALQKIILNYNPKIKITEGYDD